MALEVGTSLLKNLEKYGLDPKKVCNNCGMCSATCHKTGNSKTSFRIAIRLAQLGLKRKLLDSEELWLCDNCDECEAYCPYGNELGKLMMVLRCWVIDQKIGNK
ncbi:MAG: 4Fe-4S dicluster domain-containing protein [Candidatus Kariarchaeaceae archaeon]|jgi:heterodisulfide reductase subunit C